MDLDFYKRITAAGLTPNQYFAVYFLLLDTKQEVKYNTDVELRLLKKQGFLTNACAPTEKLLNTGLFDDLNKIIVEDNEKEKSLERKIAYYISLFPYGKLPSGAYARASVNEVKLVFKEFFEQYDYSWDVIYQATRNYIEDYAKKNYLYMRNCKYFILKNNGQGASESQLALECEAVLNKQTEYSSFDKDI